ncbi:MAG: sulfatase-like hydrolase/transferase [Acidobacteria bacterium]|nr:sulfatase-like hydrolase/transferase [Acidobacteriota bacterium]
MRKPVWFALLTLGVLALFLVRRQGSPPNLVVITIDTTRTDFLGCYGGETPLTPNIDRLAREGVRFDRAFSAIPLTTPSHASIFTGRYPFNHGVRDNGSFILPESQITLAEVLKRKGYATGAAVGSFPLVRTFGLNQGFDFYDDAFVDDKAANKGLFFADRPAGRVNDAILPWIEQHANKPFFAWIHYYDPHHPHHPPAPYDELYAENPYAGEIAYMDEAIGIVMERLGQWGLSEKTIVVVVADHGEGRGEHREETHSHLLYNTTQHVPWIIWQPGTIEPKVVDDWVSLVDVMPTLLDLLHVGSPKMDGRSTTQLMRGIKETDGRILYAETLSPRLSHGWGELRAVYQRPWKYIHGPRPELYEIDQDLSERHNQVETGPADQLRAVLAQLLETWPEPDLEMVLNQNRDDLELLQSLGYVSSGSSAWTGESLSEEGVPPQDFAADVSNWSLARQFLYEGNAWDAKQLIEPLLRKNPESRTYLELMAATYIQLGQPTEARTVYETLLNHHPLSTLNPAIPHGLGVLMLMHQQQDEALRFLNLSIQIEPNVDILYGIAKLHQVRGDQPRYVDTLVTCTDLDPTHVQSHLDLGIERAKANDLDAAEELFIQVTRINPLDARGWYNLGAIRINLQDNLGAIPFLEKALFLDKHYLQAQLGLVAVWVNLGDRERAASACSKVEAMDPDGQATTQARSLLESM